MKLKSYTIIAFIISIISFILSFIVYLLNKPESRYNDAIGNLVEPINSDISANILFYIGIIFLAIFIILLIISLFKKKST